MSGFPMKLTINSTEYVKKNITDGLAESIRSLLSNEAETPVASALRIKAARTVLSHYDQLVGKQQNPKPGTYDWNLKAHNLLKNYAPEVYPCKECQQPVISGFVCTFCGCDTPEIDNV